MLTIQHVTEEHVRTLSPQELTDARPDDGYLWVDLQAPTDDQEEILETLDIHPMAVEDMRDDRHLPKLDVFRDAFSLTVHGMRIVDQPSGSASEMGDGLETVELDIYVTHDMVVTFHEEPVASVQAVLGRMAAFGSRGLVRPVQLVHLLLDTMNDVFVPFLDHIQARIDVVEDDLLTTPTEQTRRDIFRLQRDVIQLRRAVVPQAEVIRRLGRGGTGIVEEADVPLFKDVYDHLYRMAELSESYRQLLDSALASYRSAQDERLNDMLVVLTLVSATLLPVSVIAGIWGTNFVDLPGANRVGGFWLMMASFAVIIIGMVTWFRLRGWIGSDAEDDAERRRGGLSVALEVPILGRVLQVPVAGVQAVRRTTTRRGDGET